jgi:hypothetical protein
MHISMTVSFGTFGGPCRLTTGCGDDLRLNTRTLIRGEIAGVVVGQWFDSLAGS